MSFSCLSQFFILNQRGNSIIRKELRGDLPITTKDTFYRNVKFWGGKRQNAPPIFLLHGITYLYIQHNGLYFVATTKQCVSPSFIMELLTKISKIFKDYCGILTDETIKENFILLYELLDEILDFGYAQSISSQILKEFVFNEPSIISTPSIKKVKKHKININILSNKKTTKSPDATNKPIGYGLEQEKNQKQEIYIDILERVSVTFNGNGHQLSSSIDGTIRMKSYLSGNPTLKLALNDDLLIDDINFNESVCLDQFETSKILTFIPGDGECDLCNYRITNVFDAPFIIFPYFQLISPYKAELIIKIRSDNIPKVNYGVNICVKLPVPIQCQTVTTELEMNAIGQSAQFYRNKKEIIWKLKKFVGGGNEHKLKITISFKEKQRVNIKKKIGPISLLFEIPMYNISNLQVKYLRIMESQRKFNPHRWVRYITKTQSYICRL